MDEDSRNSYEGIVGKTVLRWLGGRTTSNCGLAGCGGLSSFRWLGWAVVRDGEGNVGEAVAVDGYYGSAVNQAGRPANVELTDYH